MTTPEDVAALAALFAGYSGAHGTHGEPVYSPERNKYVIKTTARTLREPVTAAHWAAHVGGTRPLGVMPIREDGTCVWGSIDVDDYSIQLADVLRRVAAARLPLVPCRSKSGGLHLFLFLTEAAPAGEVQAALRDMAAALGYAGSEIFPPQASLNVERGDLGSWMVMPYLGTTYGGRIHVQAGLRPTGAELTLGEFVRAARAAAIPPATLTQHRGAVTRARPAPRAVAGGEHVAVDDFSDGPPCLQHLSAQGVQPGGQNNTLLMMGIYYKLAYPGDWAARLEAAGRDKFTPPAAADSVSSAIRSLQTKDYNYTCQKEPMAGHCDSRTCRTRRHGVGAWGDYPQLTGLTVLTAEPAIWFVDVDGRRLELGTEDLQVYLRFHKVAMEKLHACYRPMRQDSWLALVNAAMADVTVIDAPEEASPGAELRDHLGQFLTNRRRGQRREDLLTGRPWEDEEGARHYFQLAAFQDHLRREGEKSATRGRLTQFIRGLGGDRAFLHVGDSGVNAWWVPAALFEPPARAGVPPVRQEGPI